MSVGTVYTGLGLARITSFLWITNPKNRVWLNGRSFVFESRLTWQKNSWVMPHVWQAFREFVYGHESDVRRGILPIRPHILPFGSVYVNIFRQHIF